MSYFGEVAQEIEAGRLKPVVAFDAKAGSFEIQFEDEGRIFHSPEGFEKLREWRRVLNDALRTERATIKLTGDGYRITEVRA